MMSDLVRFGILRRFYDADRSGSFPTVDIGGWSSFFKVSTSEVVSELRYLVDKDWIKGEYVAGSEVPVVMGITAEGKDAFEQYVARTTEQESGQMTRMSPIEIKESLEEFKRNYPDSAKVGFIIMKFGKTHAHERLVKAIRSTLALRGLAGVRSDDRQYHDDLYWNVLTYAYGCGFGIAVYEHIEAEEFNPNVSLEVGYVLGLHKPVCLLKDRTLRKMHADLLGKLYKEFDQQDPEWTIGIELPKWLIDKNLGEPVFHEIKPGDSVEIDGERMIMVSEKELSPEEIEFLKRYPTRTSVFRKRDGTLRVIYT